MSSRQMIIYSPTPIRGYAPRLLHYHVWSIDRHLIDCYHYNVDDEAAKALIAEGKAKELTEPFACLKERDDGPTLDIHT